MTRRTTNERQLWTELDGSPQARAPRESVNGPPPEIPPTSMVRRDFLKALGITGVVGLASCQRLPVHEARPYLDTPDGIDPGVPVQYASTCTACSAACGLMVTTIDGRPIKLEGHPAHPLSQGGLCASGQADLRGLYDSGRLTHPTIEGAERGWVDLDAVVIDQLAAVREAGKQVAVLTPAVTSPAARAAVETFAAAHGGRWVQHELDPECPAARTEAYSVLDGDFGSPDLRLDRAELLVVLGADLLGAGPEPVADTRRYAEAKRRAQEHEGFRHLQVEGCLTLTGAAADERWLATASERRQIALALLERIAAREAGPDAIRIRQLLGDLPAPPVSEERIAELSEALHRHRGNSLVVSGDNDLGAQVAVALLNRLLGNEGNTLDLDRPTRVHGDSDGDLVDLLAAVQSGEVGALIVVGLDPVDQLPRGAELTAALAEIPLSVAITDRPTATADASQIVAASHHGLECWGDARPRSDVLTLAQPTIQPLFDTRHPYENFLVWSEAPTTDYLQHLRGTWRDTFALEHAGFEDFWARSVAAGAAVAEVPTPPPPAPAPDLVEGEETPPEADAPDAGNLRWAAVEAALATMGATGDGELEIDVIGEVGLRGGRRAHIPWLRELPDPLTRVSWTPVVRIAPDLAREMGVEDGDVIDIEASDNQLTLPVRIMPGQHPRVLGVPVGYGRQDGDLGRAERNGSLLTLLAGERWIQRGIAASARSTGGHEDLPLVQIHNVTEGRPTVHEVSRGDEALHHEHHGPVESLWPQQDPYKVRWEMVIDLDLCTGCGACVVACQAENNIPVVGPDEVRRFHDMSWLRIDRYFAGDPAQPDVLFEPMLCAQCHDAPCETVCPVLATVQGHDGINQQAYNRCVGTRYCANNCPYKMRRFNWLDYRETEPLEQMALNPNVVVRERGVMEKCTFCVQRIQAARIASRRDGEPEQMQVQTACQQTCPAGAIHFGNSTDPDGIVAQLKHSPRAFQVLPDLDVGPAVTYLARVRRRHGAADQGGHA